MPVRIAARILLLHLFLLVALISVLAALGELQPDRLAVGGSVLAIAAGTSCAIAVRTTRPHQRFAEAIRAAAKGNLDQRLERKVVGDWVELADTFDQINRGLQEAIGAASREKSRLIAALDSSVDAVVALDGDGGIAFVNAAAERFFSRTRQELVGSPFAWVMPEERVVEALRRSREEGQHEICLVEGVERQHFQVISTPIIGGGDWVALLVFHDLTEVKRVEDVRRDFVANVSHELRTPLAAIKAVLETLQGGALEDKAMAQDFLSRADVELDRLVQMVEELLELSRIESGEFPLTKEPVEMATVLADAVNRLKPQSERSGIQLVMEVEDNLPTVIGDAERLERVVVSLIHNALKFTSIGEIRVSATVENGKITVRVSDSGVGIAPDELPRVFERFYKADRARSRGGTGLGLAVVKHTVLGHGGSVAVESEEGKGSTFIFSIPVAGLPRAESGSGPKVRRIFTAPL